jgi:hypothetical protein
MSIITGVGSPGTVSAASGGYILAYNDIYSTPQQVVGQDPQRKKLTFHNPGANDIFIAPTVIQTTGSDVIFTPSPTALGGCFRVFANGGTLVIEGECQKPWQAFAASGTTNPLTVVVSHV